MDQTISATGPCESAFVGDVSGDSPKERGIKPQFVNIVGGRHYDLESWRVSVAGQWFQWFCERAEDIRRMNVVFLDIEFNEKENGIVPKLACWYESSPPQKVSHNGRMRCNDEIGRRYFLRAINRADVIVGYNLFSLDTTALDYLGFDVENNLLKLVDPYQFFFKYVSEIGKGSLEAVSLLNGGKAKYRRIGCSNTQFMKQCQRDLEMLRFVFDKMLDGNVTTSLLGTIGHQTFSRGD